MSTPTKEQSGYLSTLEEVANILQKAQINLKKCPKQRLTEGYIQARIKTIDEYWETIKQTHQSLVNCTSREQREDLSYFTSDLYYTVEDLYLCLSADLSDMLLKLRNPKGTEMSLNTTNSSQEQLCFAKLPRIQLPTFTGKYEDWPTYQDLFMCLVHNSSISEVQKLHYLKTSVSGEAEFLLRHIQITGTNYTQAWELLKERFGNKRMIVSSLLKRLFGQKKILNQSANHIKGLLDTTVECLNSLKNLEISTESWDPVIIFLVAQKLDSESLKEWEVHAYKENSTDLPTWKELKKFLESKFRTLELVTPTTSSFREKRIFHITSDDCSSENVHTNNKQISCSYCKSINHYIFGCKEFVRLPVEKRHEFVKNNSLCFNCLVPNHTVFKCKHKTTCRVCRRKHHSLLHLKNEKHEQLQQQPEPEHSMTTAHFSQPGRNVLLATAQVEVKSNNGDTYIIRALLDQGSEASFVSEKVVQMLGLKKTNINGVVSGVGEGTMKIPIKHLVHLAVTSRFNKKAIQVQAYILKGISTNLPSKHVVTDWPELETLQLADPTYNTPSRIDMLLGADVFCKVIEEGVIKMSDGVVAQKTILGWILSGQKVDQKQEDKEHKVTTFHITSMIKEDNDMLRRFWEIETELYKKKKLLTKEERECEEIYKNTTTRDITGKYTVSLPLKQSIEETVKLCGNTRQQAVNRFKYLERRFEKDNKLKTEYIKVMHEYIDMGHMRKSSIPEDEKTIYLPHHAVVRNDKETTKVRVVLDASAKGNNGHSLNDTMMVGPVLQPDLRSLIIKWRAYKIAVTGDIIKMYRMVNMVEEHTNLQRIVWRDRPDEELISYNLTTVTFGTAAAPYLAVRTLIQLADDEMEEHPTAAPVIKNNFYMDDLVYGGENEEEVKKICKELERVLNKGGFSMQKWFSNSEEVLKFLQKGEETTNHIREIKLDKVIKILGLTWDRKEDVFKIKVNLPDKTNSTTKRLILSDVARLFDPFGWLAPVIITAKVLIQKLWLNNFGWDEELPLKLSEEWMTYRQELTHLQNLNIPRWMRITRKNSKQVQIHGFADASTQAYAAVTYLRVIEDNDVYITMIASKTKVAPLKQLSIPKLELCAAALLAELINDIVDLLNIPADKVFAWTDSMVVLSWLQSQPSRWRTFVANRVAETTRLVDSKRWHHVQSADNPADIATRGVKACDIADLEVWWIGPKWLREINLKIDKFEVPETDLEIRNINTNLIIQSNKEGEKSLTSKFEQFDNLKELVKVTSYCRRFLNSKKGSEKIDANFTTEELEVSLRACIKLVQQEEYGNEIDRINKNKTLKGDSNIKTLNPYLDDHGILRVGGRLRHAYLAEEAKHPIILGNKSHLVTLIVADAHARTLHGGVQLMMCYLRTKYWIIRAKSLIKSNIHKCLICARHKAISRTQIMGDLPKARVRPSRAFLHSGVDFAGPFQIMMSKGRGMKTQKAYISLFVCMSTKAIHLELVGDLTAEAFIAAFKRFVSRRGRCSDIWSDQGRNFIGANKELAKAFKESNLVFEGEISNTLALEGTQWHYIPAYSPHFGGLWEAGVKSVKYHLKRILTTNLTYEEMSTVLCQIEACLNSRPLCPIDDSDSDCIEPLTPGHFLIGEIPIVVPSPDYRDVGIKSLTRWQYTQRLVGNFWQRWQQEYLSRLQQRPIWLKKIEEFQVGDIVLVKSDGLPAGKWMYGRIVKKHQGEDGITRVYSVKSGNNIVKRPITKLCAMPINTRDNQ